MITNLNPGAQSFDGANSVAAAQRYADLDYNFLPIRTDGSKAPACADWDAELIDEFTPADVAGKGIAIKCGATSEFLLVLDFEATDVFDEFCEVVRANGLGYLIDKAPLVASPRPGVHCYLHLESMPPRNEKLASYFDEAGKKHTLIETRGSGGYVLAPGSPAECHPSGVPYKWLREPSLDDRKYLGSDEFEALLGIARSFDRTGEHALPDFEPRNTQSNYDADSPGNCYERDGDISPLLEKHGFTFVKETRSGTEYWRKPGSTKRIGHQLTFNQNGNQRLYCFSSSCEPFQEMKSYGKFAVYALLEHGGNFGAAAKQLASEGYGKPMQKKQQDNAGAQAPAQDESDGWMEDRPLYRPLPPATEFPVAALGEILGGAATAIKEATQAPLGLCGQSVLAAAALAAQARANISIDGRRYPLADFFITVGESGQRKSAVDRLALLPHFEYEQKLREIHKAELKVYQVDKEVYDAEKRRIMKAKEYQDPDARKNALSALTLPIEPLNWKVFTSEPTIEGLFKMLLNGQPSAAIFTDEGGRFMGGHSMSVENRLKTITALAKFWDGDPVDRVRGGDGIDVLLGRRVSVHLMLQPDLARQLMQDAVLIDQGFLNRVLYCFPESTIGDRGYTDFDPSSTPEMHSYTSRIKQLIEAQKPLIEGSRNELDLPDLHLSPEAKALWVSFHDEIEQSMRKGGLREDMRGYGCKAAEHALRLSGTLTLIDDVEAQLVSLDAMERAVTLVKFYLDEAERLFGSPAPPANLVNAQKVYDWLVKRKKSAIEVKDVYQNGPHFVRTAQAARSFLETLAAHGKTKCSGANQWFVRMPQGSALA